MLEQNVQGWTPFEHVHGHPTRAISGIGWYERRARSTVTAQYTCFKLKIRTKVQTPHMDILSLRETNPRSCMHKRLSCFKFIKMSFILQLDPPSDVEILLNCDRQIRFSYKLCKLVPYMVDSILNHLLTPPHISHLTILTTSDYFLQIF